MGGADDRDGPILAGVVGAPIDHSLSPLIHATWAHRAGVDGYYAAIEAPADPVEFRALVESLRVVGFAGVNVTLPHKETALTLADAASETARRAGAANMLTFRDGEVFADNSDVAGFAAAAQQAAGDALALERALVLGAGGAARAIILALTELGAGDIAIANRTMEKGDALAEAFGARAVDWAARHDAVGEADIIINTTSLGMTGEPSLEIDLAGAKPDALVADIVYAPLETPLLRAAAARGLKTADGLAMLMHQAVPGFNAWFGAKAVVDNELREALVAELARRAAEAT